MLLAVGSMVSKAGAVRKMLEETGIQASVINCSTVKPFDDGFLSTLPKDSRVFTMEEHMIAGGFGEALTRYCMDHGYPVPLQCFGIGEEYIQHGNHELLMRNAGLDPESMAESIRSSLKGEKTVE